jgi:hypothetical protein
MTREERVELMLTDMDAYLELVPGEHWLQLLDGIAKAGPFEPEDES